MSRFNTYLCLNSAFDSYIELLAMLTTDLQRLNRHFRVSMASAMPGTYHARPQRHVPYHQMCYLFQLCTNNYQTAESYMYREDMTK
jgi:hypothetical protein